VIFQLFLGNLDICILKYSRFSAARDFSTQFREYNKLIGYSGGQEITIGNSNSSSGFMEDDKLELGKFEIARSDKIGQNGPEQKSSDETYLTERGLVNILCT